MISLTAPLYWYDPVWASMYIVAPLTQKHSLVNFEPNTRPDQGTSIFISHQCLMLNTTTFLLILKTAFEINQLFPNSLILIFEPQVNISAWINANLILHITNDKVMHNNLKLQFLVYPYILELFLKFPHWQ